MCQVLLDIIDICFFPQIDFPPRWLWATYLNRGLQKNGDMELLSMYDGWDEKKVTGQCLVLSDEEICQLFNVVLGDHV